MTRVGIGIDIGGSGIKGALVDLDAGVFIGERHRIPTPTPSTPKAVAKTCAKIVEELGGPEDAPIGIAMPAPMRHNIIGFMANLDQGWVGKDAKKIYEKQLGRPVTVLNDADAAGVAECAFGAAKDVLGTVIVTTLGTGIGSALIYDGILVPNTELGHLELDGRDAETHASAKQRTRYDLSWEEWGARLDRYYNFLEMLFSPDRIVVGGGVSKNHEEFLKYIKLKDSEIVPAELFNTAGIVGAAYYADQQS
ncbi:MAG: ROK family protein [Scrofimicrobium sp.]